MHSSKIIDRALALTDLLQHEFLFVRSCESPRQKLEQTMERMVQEGLLVKRGYSTASMTSTGSSSGGVRFCLDKNQTYTTTTATPSSAPSSRGSSSSLAPLDDDSATTQSSDKLPRRKRNATDEAFYLPSEDDDLADMEDEADEEDDDDMFSRRYSSSLFSQRRSSYGIASLIDAEDDYSADVIRFYASILAPLLETYKFAFKSALAELAQPATDGTLMKTQWKTGMLL